MTFVMAVLGRDTVWLVADRRLSRAGQVVLDDAMKVLRLETKDGGALLAYSGLGMTQLGTEPSAWMSRVLRGRGELTLEESLVVLTEVAKRELADHWRAGEHSVIAAGFVTGEGPRVYSLDHFLGPTGDRTADRHNVHRFLRLDLPGSPPPRIAMRGSGVTHFMKNKARLRRWLLDLVSAHESGRLSGRRLGLELAKVSYEVHLNTPGGTVGPNCVVVSSRRKDPTREGPGGEILVFEGTQPATGRAVKVPTITRGWDIAAHGELLMASFREQAAQPGFDVLDFRLDLDEIVRQERELGSGPDEELR